MVSAIHLKIQTPFVFQPLTKPSRYKGAHGGRGSGKSHFFAAQGVKKAIVNQGFRWVCIREVQKSLKDSAKRLIEDKIQHMGAESMFDIQSTEIKTPGGGIVLFQGMQDHTAESIKSLEGFDLAWVEEAHTLSERSLELLRPTIRRDPTPGRQGSEIWASWNPRSANDPIDDLLRGLNPPLDSIVVKADYTDNPFFPDVLEQERLYDEQHKRERYGHVWLGEYEPMAIGAIWTRLVLHQGRRETAPSLSRIVVAIDPAVTNEGDEHGIIVCAHGEDERGYVLADASTHGGPRDWASRAIAMYDRYEADAIVIEVNQGGDMVRHTLESVRKGPRIIEVRATKGKHVRAEPISALYDLGRISHIGTFGKLEDQMCRMTAAGYEGEGSPDRVDALVWGMTELFPALIAGKYEGGPDLGGHSSGGGWLAA